MSSVDVSFITINYNSSEYTRVLIESVEKNTYGVSYEIIIVDNASVEEDFLALKKIVKDKDYIKLIPNSVNSGFSGGNMLGVLYAKGGYYFFINNDCKILNNAAIELKSFLDRNTSVALATGKLFDDKKRFSSSYKQFPHILRQLFGNSVQRYFSKAKFPSNKEKLSFPSKVEVVSGACMFFDAEVFCKIGGFDAVFFLYCEEEDISKRVWDIGKEVYFVPSAEIFHAAGGSSNQGLLMEQEFYISYYHLLDKHYRFLGRFLLKFALSYKLFLRIFKRKNGLSIFLKMLGGFSKKNSLRYSQVINKRRMR